MPCKLTAREDDESQAHYDENNASSDSDWREEGTWE